MSSVEPVRRLPNFVDNTSAALLARDSAVGVLSRLFELRGFERIETPLIEQAELFVRKSGGELSSRLYGFVEPGGYRVGLRPEFTAPVLRHAIDDAGGGALPRRYQYAGPVFRYASPEDEDGSKTRQFTQVGAEVIGSSAPLADGEIIAAAYEGLAALGVPTPIVTVGHVGIFWDVLKPFGLSDRARLFLVNSVGQLRKGDHATDVVRAEAERLGLTGAWQSERSALPRGASLDEVAAVIDATIGPTDANAGVRSREEIVERLTRKRMMVNDPEAFSSAFDLVANLARVQGDQRSAAEAGRAVIAAAGGDRDSITPVVQVIDAAVEQGVPADSILVDLGLARGIAYYTGMVFDLHSGESGGDSLGGGGRYDGLTKALGASTDLPALGFAYSLEAVIDAAGGADVRGKVLKRVVVAPDDVSALGAAALEARQIRSAGAVAVLDFMERTAVERRSYAADLGASEVVVVKADGKIKREAVR